MLANVKLQFRCDSTRRILVPAYSAALDVVPQQDGAPPIYLFAICISSKEIKYMYNICYV